MHDRNYCYIDEIQHDPKSVVTVGTFDGVHEGHKSIIHTLVETAGQTQSRSVLVTFDPHPREVINPEFRSTGLLTTLEERADALKKLGVNNMVVIPFSRDFSLLDSETFIREYIQQKIGLHTFVIGYDHHFGRNREGSKETLEKLGKTQGFNVIVVQAHELEEVTVSSTMVRKALQDAGDIALAAQFLGQPYMLKCMVVHGDKRGRTIGFPTANLEPLNKGKIIPKNGVYAVLCQVDGQEFPGMMNIGVRPTVKQSAERTLEAHLFDVNLDLYGKKVNISFIRRIRDEMKFSGLEQLTGQLRKDKEFAADVIKTYLSNYPKIG